jgi:hypothetical protein
MVKGETVMPTPQGDITSTETWDETPAEVVEEVVEEQLPEEELDQA